MPGAKKKRAKRRAKKTEPVEAVVVHDSPQCPRCGLDLNNADEPVKWSEIKLKRKWQLTPHLIDGIAQIVSEGAFPSVAARVMGVPESTFRGWRLRGKHEPNSIYGDLREAIDAAQAAKELKLVERWRSAGEGGPRPDWRSSQALLGKMFPDRWGEHLGLRGEEDREEGRLSVDQLLGNLSEDEQRELMRLLDKAANGGRRPEVSGEAPSAGFRSRDVPGLPGRVAPSSDNQEA